MEQFQCRRIIDGKRCENQMYRQNIGDAFDFPDCESCHERSKREDPVLKMAKLTGDIMNSWQDTVIQGCGALNSQETD